THTRSVAAPRSSPCTTLFRSGWWLITTQLNHERIALSAVGYVDRIFEDTCAWARATRLASGERVIDRPWVQLHLARAQAHVSSRSEEHTSELQSPDHLVCRLL